MLRATKHTHTASNPVGQVTLDHAQRHLRRKRITLDDGSDLIVDLPKAVQLAPGDALVTEQDKHIEIIAARQKLFCLQARDDQHFAELCWHLGNRHCPAQITERQIFIEADPVLRNMLEGLGARISELEAPFQPVHGAYHTHASHAHD